jgi:hypothetical protein
VRAEPSLANTSASPGLAGRAVELLPGLARHTCENGTSHGMIAELASTETCHLLEHVAVECMALSGSPRSLKAETVWDFAADGPGVYRVRLAYDIDLVALAALREGLRASAPRDPTSTRSSRAYVRCAPSVRRRAACTGARRIAPLVLLPAPLTARAFDLLGGALLEFSAHLGRHRRGLNSSPRT